MAHDLWEQLRTFAGRLRIEGLLDWADELDDLTRHASTGSEALMGARWVLARLVATDEAMRVSTRSDAHGLIAELTDVLGRT
jgi:hypothetical protein